MEWGGTALGGGTSKEMLESYISNAKRLKDMSDGARTRGSDMNYVGAFVRVDTPFGLPLVKGPWGRITAIDMHTGDHRWMVPNGHAPKARKAVHCAPSAIETFRRNSWRLRCPSYFA